MSRELLDDFMADLRKVARNKLTINRFIAKWTDTPKGKTLEKWIAAEKSRIVESRDCKSTQHLQKLLDQFDDQYPEFLLW